MTLSVSFKNFKSSSSAASKTLARIKSRETNAEKLLRSALWKHGVRFRKNVRTLPGKPDVVIGTLRLVIFCDGDFWHGKDWQKHRERLSRGPNSTYWVKKIAANIERDKKRTKELRRLGWTVVRVWESDVRKNPNHAAEIILDTLFSSNSKKDRMGRLRL